MKFLIYVLTAALVGVALTFFAVHASAADVIQAIQAAPTIADGPLTAEQLKALLQTPRYLFFAMLLATFASMLTAKVDANRNGAGVTLGAYLGHWRETLATVVLNIIGFVLLIMTDQLNFAAAVGVGFGINQLADLTKKGGRSAALQASP